MSGSRTSERVRIRTLPDASDRRLVLAELSAALSEEPPRIPSRHFYDERGSRLFERITRLDAYYPTRTEAALLAEHADAIVEATRARELVELGSGTAVKTRLLLDAMARRSRLDRYVPFDISPGTLRASAEELCRDYAGLEVDGLVGDFSSHLDELPAGGERLVIFLGGTIGNFDPAQRDSFLATLAEVMHSGEHFLLGIDLIKDRHLLEAAYDDPEGITAEFNRNILLVVNRLAGGDFDPGAFAHRATWNEGEHRIEMWLDARRAETVRLPALGIELAFERDDSILTELSTKYDRPLVERALERHDFRLERWISDGERLFALALAVRI